MKKISKALKNYIIDAVLLIVLGLIMLLWPQGSLATIFKILGIALIVMGAIKGIVFFTKKEDKSVPSLLVGVLQLVAGIIILVKSDFFVSFFPIVAAIILAYGAVVMLIHAMKLRNGSKNTFTLSLVLGIVTVILAVIIFTHPAVLANVMIQAAGVSLIVEGIALAIVLSRKAD